MKSRLSRRLAFLLGTVIFSCLLLALAAVGLHQANRGRLNLDELDDGLDRLLERSARLAARAGAFEPDEALSRLGVHPSNGFVYRLEDHIADARIELAGPPEPGPASSDYLLALDFDHGERVPLEVSTGDLTNNDGVLEYRAGPDVVLRNIEPLDIPKDAIDEIEIRFRATRGKRFVIAWSDQDVRHLERLFTGRRTAGRTAATLSMPIVDNTGFHLYHINARTQVHLRKTGIQRIRSLLLYLSDHDGAEVQLDYIRLVSKERKYAAAPVGRSHETLRNEMRKVLYLRAPASLGYRLRLPARGTRLSFGLGSLHDDVPAQVEVSLEAAGRRRVLLEEAIEGERAWRDVDLDLSEWSGKEIVLVFRAGGERRNVVYLSNPALWSVPGDRLDVILVLEDSLRADHLSSYGYARPTTPVKDRLREGGVQFDRAISQATKTRPSCVSFMTSLLPSGTGVWSHKDTLGESHLTLAEIMRSLGFETASFIQNSNAGPSAGLHQGFSSLFYSRGSDARAADIYSDDLYRWLERHRDRNVFLYLHLIDPHGVYDAPREYRQWYDEIGEGEPPLPRDDADFDPAWVDRPTVRGRIALYDGEVRYNDFWLGEFLDSPSMRERLASSLLVFLSDHGELLGEHDEWGHCPPGFYRRLNVPLIMRYPGVLPAGRRIAEPVQLLDLVPTVLDLLDVETDGLLLGGESLVPLVAGGDPEVWRDRVAISEEVTSKRKDDSRALGSLFFGRWHVLNSRHLEPGALLRRASPFYMAHMRAFDIERDPNESESLDEFYLDYLLKRRLYRRMAELQAYHRSVYQALHRSEDEAIVLDQDVVDQLRELGYLE